MAYLSNAVRKDIAPQLARMGKTVRLIFFTQDHPSGACREQRQLLEELTALSAKLSLEVRELIADTAEAKRYRIDKVPATVVLGERDHGIRFFGVTGGYEFGSLLESIVMVSTEQSGLDPELAAFVRRIVAPVHLEILVTLTCPYCPQMVRLAHQLAFLNDRVQADMIDAAEFPALTQRYRVRGVPLTVVNEHPAFEGALPPADAIKAILKQGDPQTFEAMEAALGAAREQRKATAAQSEREYDILVVGAGPAAMAAALYAVRKGRRVAILGVHPGGQITDTATVENYLGMMEIGGSELAEMFRRHLESHPVAERIPARVTRVQKIADAFAVQADDGTVYHARSVIYAAGKQYRRLNVPGEARFIGRGIAFCATCDAPLFQDRKVAVVGGGNSALTAVRDLQRFAREIHLIHVLDRFQADQVLIDEVRNASNVTLHMQTEVKEFLGDDALSGVRLASVDGKDRYDLQVDGVFLEIGLTPNTEPVDGLVTVNAVREIPVDRNQATSVPGLFAAGDVTDERDKQIIIAAGDGARAALSADLFLAQLPART